MKRYQHRQRLKIDELEERIASDAIARTGTSDTHDHGTEVSNGARAQPEPSER